MRNSVLDALRVHARQRPHAVALIGVDASLHYAELTARIDALAAWLRARGVQRIGLWGENSAAWVVADLAAAQAGAVAVPMPPFFSAEQLRHVLDAAGLQHVLACGDLPLHAGGEPTPLPGLRLATLATPAHAPVLPAGTLKITFTSGTTGTPKGVCLTSDMLDATTHALATRLQHAAGLGDAVQTHFCVLPLATLLENIAGVHVPLLLGKRVVVRDGAAIGLAGSSQLDVARLLQALHRDRPDSLIVLPQILRALVTAAERGMPAPDSLRFIAVGGAATPPALLARAHDAGLPAYEGYGLSECASVVALNVPGANRPGSVGRVLGHVRVRIGDGAIEVAGNVFPGYLGEPARGAEAWLDTGDVGRLDDDGYLYVTGRRKHVLITGYGRNVSPEWVEAELALQPAIAQCIVTGDGQPHLAAIVVPARDADASAVASAVADANRALPDYARIGACVLADAPFSAAAGTLTDNGRPRRDAILARHAGAIAVLYADASSCPPCDANP